MRDLVGQILGPEKVINEPFPYLVLPGIFSADLYDEMLRQWPPLEVMTYAPSNLPNRYWIYIHGHDPVKVDARIEGAVGPATFRFWQGVRVWLASDWVKLAFFSKFGLAPESSSFHTIRLVTDVQGYSIDRHPDGETKVLSVLIYCPETDAHPEWGTSIDGTTIPFIPNHLFAFAKTDDSFHWVNEITQEGARRNQILLVYEK